jgi:hypothetical protein
MHNSLKIIKTLLYSYSALHVSGTLAPIIRSLLLCIWLVFYSLSSLILSNLKHELLNRLNSTRAANVLISQVHLPSFVKMLPKYLKDSTFSSCFWSIIIFTESGYLEIPINFVFSPTFISIL